MQTAFAAVLGADISFIPILFNSSFKTMSVTGSFNQTLTNDVPFSARNEKRTLNQRTWIYTHLLPPFTEHLFAFVHIIALKK